MNTKNRKNEKLAEARQRAKFRANALQKPFKIINSGDNFAVLILSEIREAKSLLKLLIRIRIRINRETPND